MLVVLANERGDSIRQFVFAFEAPPIKRLTLQQAKHDLDLIVPACRGRREVEPNSTLGLAQPFVVSCVQVLSRMT